MSAFFHHYDNQHPFSFGSLEAMCNDHSVNSYHGESSSPEARSRSSSISNLDGAHFPIDGCYLEKKRSRQDSFLSVTKQGEPQGRRSRKQKRNGEEKEKKAGTEPPLGYIHVRARRGQATDSHSLAERVRREKISERMKVLQGLVPGCEKVVGKALMLDEIINYVQSLQNQIEFLSLKLACVNPMTLDLSGEYKGLSNKEGVEEFGYTMPQEPRALPSSSLLQASLVQPRSVDRGAVEESHLMIIPPIPVLGQGPSPPSQDNGSLMMQMGDHKEAQLNYILLNNMLSFP